MKKYYTSDITFCDCGCKNGRCDRHIRHIHPMKGKGYYSVADYSNNCPDFRGSKKKLKG